MYHLACLDLLAATPNGNEANTLTICQWVAPVASIVVAGFSAYFGFWFACKRDGVAARQAASVKLALLEEKLRVAHEQEVAGIHSASIQDICSDIIRAIHTLRGKKKRGVAQRSWEIYRDLKPSDFRLDKLGADISAWQIKNGVNSSHTKTDLYTPKEVMTYTLKALQHQMLQ